MKISHIILQYGPCSSLRKQFSLASWSKGFVPFEHCVNHQENLSCQQETLASVFPVCQLNTAGETQKGQVACHSESSVLFSRLENNDWSVSIYNTLLWIAAELGITLPALKLFLAFSFYLCFLIWPPVSEIPKQEKSRWSFYYLWILDALIFKHIYYYSHLDVFKISIMLSYS